MVLDYQRRIRYSEVGQNSMRTGDESVKLSLLRMSRT